MLGLSPTALGAEAVTNVPPPPPTVTITHAVTPAPAGELLLPGTIEAAQETLIFARTDGYVRRWYREIGDKVKAGDLLLEIDAPEVDQAAKQATAALAQATANLEIARTTYTRWKALVDKKTVSEHDLDERRAAFEARQADLAAAHANVQRLVELQGFKRITAPFGGVVTVRNVEHGALVAAGSGGADRRELYRIAEVDQLRMRLHVPQTHMRTMLRGVEAEVLVAEFPDRRFKGQVVRTAGAIDPASRTLLTEIEIPNRDGALLPGLYAQVKFNLPYVAGTVLVPTNAVRLDATGAHIATVNADNTIKMQIVALGRNLGTQLEILSGLAANASVVLNPTDDMKDGLVVVAKEAISPKP